MGFDSGHMDKFTLDMAQFRVDQRKCSFFGCVCLAY
jgi:hypothetical protein